MMPLCLLQASPADQLSSITSQFFDYVKLLLILVAILVMAYLSVRYFLPRIFGLQQAAGAGPIQVVARFVMEPRKTLYIVKIGEDTYLMGTSDTEIYYFTSLDAKALEPFLGQHPTPPPGMDFARLLRRTPKE
ncbi:MAG: flagellar biosynthetic protein FliO [Candidatus Solibacter usitatus]|nr:flagellar biosynthetic protein FliO [Candidatus Solibacter usitatus]